MMLMLLLIPLLFAASVFLFAISLIPNKNPLSKQLEELQALDFNDKSESREEAFARIFGAERRASLAKRLVEAGWYSVTPAQMGIRMLAGSLLGATLGIALLRFSPLPFAVGVFAMLLFVIVGAYAPLFSLNQAIDARKITVQKTLPDFLDMVATTVQAGLSVNAALAYAVESAPGALGDEMKEALSEIRLGRPRSDALKAVAARVNHQQLTSTVTAITQAERLGSNISAILNELADDVRHQRMMNVEEAAAKLPVKMTFPMAFFMLPSIFVIIFGSVAANILQNGMP